MEKHQGEDIALSIKVWTNNSRNELLNLDNVSDIIVYIYTDGCKKAKLSKTDKEGYIKLSKVSQFEYSGIVDSSITKLLSPGTLYMDVNVSQDSIRVPDGKWNIIQRTAFGILKKSLIKVES